MTSFLGRQRALVAVAALVLMAGLFLMLSQSGGGPVREHESYAERLIPRETRALPQDADELESGVVSASPQASDRQPVAESVQVPGMISGIVLDQSGQPVGDAVCSLFGGKAPPGLDSLLPPLSRRDSLSVARASARSDSEGRFRLPAAEGHWLLRVEVTGSIPWEEDHLKAGDFRWVRLEPGVRLIVRVQNRSSQPLEGCELGILQYEYFHFESAIVRARTNSSGIAEVAIPSGYWFIAVKHPDYQAHFEQVSISAEDRRVEKGVVLSRGIRVFGRVSTIAGLHPPAGTAIVVDSHFGAQQPAEHACDADGSFSTGHVFYPGQLLEVAAIAPGFGEVRREVNLEDIAPDVEDVEIVFVLERHERFVRGRVVDQDGLGLVGIRLFVVPLLKLPPEGEIVIPEGTPMADAPDVFDQHRPQKSSYTRWRSVGTTDERGEFLVGGMDSLKPYSILIVSERHSNARRWIPEADSGSVIDVGTITLTAGGRIHGIVRTRDGHPVAGVTLNCFPFIRTEITFGVKFMYQWPRHLISALNAVTNRDGEFAIEPLSEGEYFLSVGQEQFGPFAVRAGENRGPEIIELERDPRDENYRSVSVSGRVLGVDGAPVTSALVQMFRDANPSASGGGASYELIQASYVNDDGDYRLSMTRPGRVVLKAIDIDGGFDEKSVEVDAPTGDTSVDIVLSARAGSGAHLSGVVFGPAGEMLSGQTVTLHISPSITSCACVSRTSRTDATGQFDFGPIAAGAHRIVVTDPEGRFKPQDRFPARAGDFLEVVMEQ